MILFWVICAGLVAIALAFILPTLLERGVPETIEADREEANVDIYRDQLSELEADRVNGIISPEQYQEDRTEIERRLLDDVSAATPVSEVVRTKSVPDRTSVYAVAFGIPVIAVVLYLLVGNARAISGETTTATAASADGQMTQQGIEANVAALAKRLEQNPGDAQGWAMLARSYLSQEKFSDASNAYAKAAALKTDDANLLIEYAYSLAMANNRQLGGRPQELIKQALQIEPENPKALELAGSAEYQAKNYRAAVDHWQRLLPKIPADSELKQSVTERINEAKSLAGLK